MPPYLHLAVYVEEIVSGATPVDAVLALAERTGNTIHVRVKKPGAA
jgi:hypothetical protein